MTDETSFTVVCVNYRGDILQRSINKNINNVCMLERLRDYFLHLKPIENVNLYKNRPQMLKIKIEPGITLLIFKSLKFRLMVSKRKTDRIIDTKLLDRNLPRQFWVENFELQSQTIVFQLPFNSVNLYKLSSNFFCFEPELFPAARLIFKSNENNQKTERYKECVNVFASGKVVITGFKTDVTRKHDPFSPPLKSITDQLKQLICLFSAGINNN